MSIGVVMKWSRIAATKRLVLMTMQPRTLSMLDRIELYVVQVISKYSLSLSYYMANGSL